MFAAWKEEVRLGVAALEIVTLDCPQDRDA